MIVLAVILVVTQVVIPSQNYTKAEELLAQGNYIEAMELYYKYPNHGPSKKRIEEFEAQVNSQLGENMWSDEEYGYYKDFKTNDGTWDVSLQFEFSFNGDTQEISGKQTFRYYDADTGTLKRSKGSEYNISGFYTLSLSDGVLYLNNLNDFAGSRCELVYEVTGTQIKLLEISATVDVYEDGKDYETTFYGRNVAEIEQLSQLQEIIGTSVKEAYALAKNMHDVSGAEELVAICETYYPYCGTFNITEFDGLPVYSDFYWDGDNVYWVIDQGTGYLQVGFEDEVHTFFQKPTQVIDMQCIEEYDTTAAKVSFKDDTITYIWGYYASCNVDSSGNIVSKNDYTEDFVLTMVSAE